MKHFSRILITLFMIVMPLLSAGALARPVAAQNQYTCLPTCSTTDGRFLSLSGAGYATLAGDSMNIEVAVPSTASSFDLSIFDGDTGGKWDTFSTPSLYTLYADPTADGTGTVQIGQWSGSIMSDNDWYALTLPNNNNDARAQSPSGNYFYNLHITNTNLAAHSENSFKVRGNGLVSMAPQAISFLAALWGTNEAPIIYPSWPALSPTTYDGTWDFYLNVPTSLTYLSVWDGDLDFGRYDCSVNDTDDPNTPNAPFLPDWAKGTAAVPEGVAVATTLCKNSAGIAITPNGQKYTTGDPADDNADARYLRSPDINYTVNVPDGTSFVNSNPSGNMEWELFRIGTDPSEVPAISDVTHTGVLPAGLYKVHLSGVDMTNLNAYRFDNDWEGLCPDGTVCVPVPHPYLVGDTVWYDANRNGVQDPGEAGIGGVTVNLLDSTGQIIGTTVTNSTGYYSFEVEKGTYTVQVAPSNFNPGGALAGYVITAPINPPPTPPNQKTDTVTTANVMTYDFGYYWPASIGDFVWNDINGNGIQDAGEPGIAGVTVNLLGSDGTTVVATTTTAADGSYTFTNLLPGTYFVQVVLPSGYTFTLKNAVGSTVANDSNVNPSTSKTDAIVLTKGQKDNTIDAGMYKTVPCSANLCGYIRTPGFWKNYANHMTSATFLNLVAHTQDFGYLTVQQAVTILSTNNGTTNLGLTALDGVNATFLKFLLTSEINAIWNGKDSAAGLGGQMGWGIYYGTSSTVDQLLHQAYLDRKTYSTTEYQYVLYLGAGGEGNQLTPACTTGCSCLILPPPPCTTCQPKFANLGDFVWNDLNGNGIQDAGEPGISGVTVKLLLSDGITVYATTTTGTSGKYAFNNIPVGTYYVQFTAPSGFLFTTKNAPGSTVANDSNVNPSTGLTNAITLIAGTTDNTIDAGLKAILPCKNGTWNFNLPTGLLDKSRAYTVNGLTITVYGFTNSGSSTALYGKNDGGDEHGVGIASDSDHEINANNFVQIDLSNVIASGAKSAQMMVGSVQSGEKYNIYGSNTLGSIGTLLGSANRTLDNTLFDIPNFPSYRYISLQATAANVLLEAVSINCTNPPLTAAIGDRVWNDANGNGLQDTGETGIAGVTVKLLGSDGATVINTTTTNSSGIYSFANLAAGTYYVKFVLPTGYTTFTVAHTGTDDTKDSDANVSTGLSPAVTLAAGQTNLTIDAGMKKPWR